MIICFVCAGDPYIQLWVDSDAPIEVGTFIRRRNSRSGHSVMGTMWSTTQPATRWTSSATAGELAMMTPGETSRATLAEVRRLTSGGMQRT
jgi:hypothetical protein